MSRDNAAHGMRLRTMRRDEVAIGRRMGSGRGLESRPARRRLLPCRRPRRLPGRRVRRRAGGLHRRRLLWPALRLHRPVHRGARLARARHRASPLDRGHGAARGPRGRPRRRAGAAGQLPPQRLRAGLAQRPLRRRGRAARPPEPAQIVPLGSVDFAALCADDRRVFPRRARRFLRCWTAMPDATGLAWLEQGRLAGWGVIRRCREGHKIGPLVADTPAVASACMRRCATACRRATPCTSTCRCPTPTPWRWPRHMGCAASSRPRAYAGPAPAFELQRVSASRASSSGELP